MRAVFLTLPIPYKLLTVLNKRVIIFSPVPLITLIITYCKCENPDMSLHLLAGNGDYKLVLEISAQPSCPERRVVGHEPSSGWIHVSVSWEEAGAGSFFTFSITVSSYHPLKNSTTDHYKQQRPERLIGIIWQAGASIQSLPLSVIPPTFPVFLVPRVKLSSAARAPFLSWDDLISPSAAGAGVSSSSLLLLHSSEQPLRESVELKRSADLTSASTLSGCCLFVLPSAWGALYLIVHLVSFCAEKWKGKNELFTEDKLV